jgi:AbrB family transcriptional regulator (stage V sporulation protein T)
MNGVKFLKSTGITRKIDELGRVVIPKEIRKNLCIREGESLEIITNEDNIILKKHSPIAKYNDISNRLCHIIGEIYGIDVMISDREKIIASYDKSFINKKINSELLFLLDNREILISKEIKKIYFEEKMMTGYITICPIIDDSYSIGLVIIKSMMNGDYINLGKLVAKLLTN